MAGHSVILGGLNETSQEPYDILWSVRNSNHGSSRTCLQPNGFVLRGFGPSIEVGENCIWVCSEGKSSSSRLTSSLLMALLQNNDVVTFYCLTLLMPLVGVSTAMTRLATVTAVIKMSHCLGIRFYC